MARPVKKIDEEQLTKLASIGCTMGELSAFFNVSVDTLERRYAEVIRKGREGGKTRLRRIQLQIAEKGNAVMAIFLGKNMLGQHDNVQHELKELPDMTLKYRVD